MTVERKASASRVGTRLLTWISQTRSPATALIAAAARTLLRTALAKVRRVLEPQPPAGEPWRFVHTSADPMVVDVRTDPQRARALQAEGGCGPGRGPGESSRARAPSRAVAA